MRRTAPLIDIRPDHLAIVQGILKQHVPHYPVWVFGSRAKWTAKEYSDLDLAVITDRPLSIAQSAALADDFLESDLPWKVDVVDWSATSPSFRKVIEKKYVVVQEGESSSVAGERTEGMVSEWPQVPLGEVITLQRGFDLPSQNRKPGRVPIVSSSGITDYHSEVGVSGPGVVTGRYGTIGQVFLIKEDFWPLNTTLWVKDFHGNDRLFTSYLLRTIDFMSCSDKSSVPGVNRNDLHRILVLLPPIPEQRAIAGVLGALDDKIEQNRRTAQALERLARAIFRAWFVDFEPVKAKAAGATAFPSMPQPVFDALPTRFVDSAIGPVPEGWEVKALSSICTLVGGGTPKRSEAAFWNGDVPWYSVKDVPGRGELWAVSTSERITADGLADSAARVVPKGSTIISARGTVGKLAMAGIPMAFNQSCYGLLPGDGKSFGYLHLMMQSVVAELQQRTHGSVFDTITRATFDGLLVTSPRAEVVTAFESVVAPLLALLLASVDESSKLAAMRDYLLPKLLSGQVRVQPVVDGANELSSVLEE